MYKREYSFSTVARDIKSLRSYRLLEPIGTRRGCFKSIKKFYRIYELMK